jgi:hypothetical protein
MEGVAFVPGLVERGKATVLVELDLGKRRVVADELE